jgi:serine protease Do
MSLTSKAFRVAAKKIQPCLVTIESYGGVSAVQGRIGGIRAQGEGNTTGVMISSDGYILTSTFNFVQQPPVISVVTSDGERRFAKLLGRDDTRKICLLKIDGVSDMPVPESVDPKELRIGQWALTLGVGYGDTSPAMSMGIISATNRVGGRAVQTDANISPANYGGALIDLKGRLIGVCVPLNPQSQAVGAGVEWYDSGIGFAIPMREIEKVIKRLKTGEKIMPGFIGVIAIPNPQGKGLFIQRVYQDTAASEVGLLVEDIILQINGTKVNDLLTFKSLLSKYEVGESVELTILKSGDADENPVNLTVELGSPPKPKNEPESLEPPKIR